MVGRGSRWRYKVLAGGNPLYLLCVFYCCCGPCCRCHVAVLLYDLSCPLAPVHHGNAPRSRSVPGPSLAPAAAEHNILGLIREGLEAPRPGSSNARKDFCWSTSFRICGSFSSGPVPWGDRAYRPKKKLQPLTIQPFVDLPVVAILFSSWFFSPVFSMTFPSTFYARGTKSVSSDFHVPSFPALLAAVVSFFFRPCGLCLAWWSVLLWPDRAFTHLCCPLLFFPSPATR